MHSPHPKLVNKVLKNILRNKSFKWWFYQQLWRVWDVIQVSLPQLHRGWQKTQGFWIRSEGLCHSWQSRQQALHIFPGSPGPRCRGAKAEAAPDASCSLSGFGEAQSYTGTARTLAQHLPTGKHYLYYPVRKKNNTTYNQPPGQEESATYASQNCFLDKHPWKEVRTKIITSHVETTWRLVPWQHIEVSLHNPHYS